MICWLQIWAVGNTPLSSECEFGEAENKLLTLFLLSSSADMTSENAVGNPTELAIARLAKEKFSAVPDELKNYRKIYEIPFDSTRKLMTVVYQTESGWLSVTKGAIDRIRIIPDDRLQGSILSVHDNFASQALRVIGVAYKKFDATPALTPEALENELTFGGLVGIIDPPREESAHAVRVAKEAGIKTVMITGDHLATAKAIAEQIGILDSNTKIMNGSELRSISDDELAEIIEDYRVFARTSPEDKIRIVKAFQKAGEVVAMTGDGVNDAPSIKSADIGVGMGITGTDVTKSTADMVLSDDNFATIVTAVGEGRRIYDNIRKAIQFLLSSNLAEVVAVFVSSICGFTLLMPSHLLWINLVTDCLPAVALGMEPGEDEIMNRPPRLKSESIFADGLGLNVVLHGLILAGITLAAYFVGDALQYAGGTHSIQSNQGMTMAFLTLSMAELFHAYNQRSMHGSIFKLKTHNKLLWISMLSSLLLTTAVIFVPGLNDFFHLTDPANPGVAIIDLKEYAIALALAISIIPIVEIQKLIVNAVRAKKKK